MNDQRKLCVGLGEEDQRREERKRAQDPADRVAWATGCHNTAYHDEHRIGNDAEKIVH